MGAAVQGALEQLASAPVTEISITELDIANSPVDDYTAVVQGCLNVEKCQAITVWGISDAVRILHFNASSITIRNKLTWRYLPIGLVEAGRKPFAV